MNKVKLGFQLINNMGFRYFFFRTSYAIQLKLGILKLKFPTNPKNIEVISLQAWKKNLPPFFFYGKDILGLQKKESSDLENTFNDITQGIFTFFSKSKNELGKDYDWVTNPTTGYKYDVTQHWTLIQDFSTKAGDIKFVWEKARFSFLWDIIRYDYHYSKDCAELVFTEINSFIDKNPINQGPNYKCSQEISLRIFNWTFALYYYKDSDYLTDDLFQKIMNSIYWQTHHVYHNINFSRIAVRNNHAITETLLLYLSKLLFPFLPDVHNWSKIGKNWFEEEINYQIYDDGTYLQFSNNYHRVVIQLLSLGIGLADLNKDKFEDNVFIKAKKSLDFLYNSMDLKSGYLPNYGSNDGALFFKMNDNEYRDFRPQIQTLCYLLGQQINFDFKDFIAEDLSWFGIVPEVTKIAEDLKEDKCYLYTDGGFYIIQEKDSKTYIRCGKHKDRPAQADNLHLDIWYNGINYFRDNGSYKYNAEKEIVKFFMGTRSHNTIMLDDYDQMYKGDRFIWFNWTQATNVSLNEFKDRFEFEGTIAAFGYLRKKIFHKRKVIKYKENPKWIIEDEVTGTKKYVMHQLWHINPEVSDSILINAIDIVGKPIIKEVKEGWYSSYYGVKEKTDYWQYSSDYHKITTEIEIKE